MNEQLLADLVHFLKKRTLELDRVLRNEYAAAQLRVIYRLQRMAILGNTDATFALVELAAPHKTHPDYDARWDFE